MDRQKGPFMDKELNRGHNMMKDKHMNRQANKHMDRKQIKKPINGGIEEEGTGEWIDG